MSQSNGYLQYTQEANGDIGPYGMPYADFVTLHCFHDWSKIAYERREMIPYLLLTKTNRALDKWQCKHCKRIVWSDNEPAKDLR